MFGFEGLGFRVVAEKVLVLKAFSTPSAIEGEGERERERKGFRVRVSGCRGVRFRVKNI